MDYAVVAVPAAPVRRKPNHRKEMVSQLLFGESVKVLKTKGSLWVKVRSLHDDYEGWMTNTLLREVDEKIATKRPEFVSGELFISIVIQGKQMYLPLGASLPGFTEGKGLVNDLQFDYNGNAINRTTAMPSGPLIHELTARWLNVPYMWGGRTIFGVDCSGFVQVNFKMMGIDLPRDAWQQAQQGGTVKNLKDAVCGDLAFFDDKEEIVHVGILLDATTIIHSSGRVRIDEIDKKGIINSDTGKRSHTLKSIKRYW